MTATLEISSLKELDKVSRQFLDLTHDKRKFAFYGPMGSGKTTFIKAVCKGLGATGLVTSPTFALVNEYTMTNGGIIYHFDLYRINDIRELYDLGYEEYFYSDRYVFIEWADRAESLLPDQVTRVTMEETDRGKRLIRVEL